LSTFLRADCVKKPLSSETAPPSNSADELTPIS
jgi:hypothetical protein